MTRAELIAELVASSPHLRVEDAEQIVATVFDQITAALARDRGNAATRRRRATLTLPMKVSMAIGPALFKRRRHIVPRKGKASNPKPLHQESIRIRHTLAWELL